MRSLVTTKVYTTRSGESRIRAVAGPHRKTFSFFGTMGSLSDTERTPENVHLYCAREILAVSGWGKEITQGGVLNDGTYVWFYK